MSGLFLAIIFPFFFFIVWLFFLAVLLLGTFFESGGETLSWLVLDIAVTISPVNLVVYLNSRVNLAIFWLFLVKFHFLVDSFQNVAIQDHNSIETTMGVKAACTVGALEVMREAIIDTMVLVERKLVHYIRMLLVFTFKLQVIRHWQQFLFWPSRLILLL